MNIVASQTDEVRRLALDFLHRTGMAPADFARRVGYRYNTLWQFLTDKYRRGVGSKEDAICEAILQFLGSRAPEIVDQFNGKLYEIGNTRTLRDVFQRLCDKPCILLAYAPPGSGKTDVARALMPGFRTEGLQFARVYCSQGISCRDLMREIAVKCGSIGDLSIRRTLYNLRFDFTGRRCVLYFDEAQHLSVECLETVRELYDEMHWSLCFAGSHQLDRIFTKWAGDLEQLERRVTDKVTVPAVTSEEAMSIVASELPGLPPAKARALVERSHVEIRADKSVQRYLSIGRVMGAIREIQELMPEAADAARPGESDLEVAS